MAKYYVDVNEVNRGTYWYKDEQMTIVHRENGPAIEMNNGSKYWFKDGMRHREDGPAIEWTDRARKWYKENKLHRVNGPAVEYADGYKAWYIEGKYHREDGPAREHANGDVEYWLNDEHLTKQQWEAALRPPEELTVGQIEKLLNKRIKIIK